MKIMNVTEVNSDRFKGFGCDLKKKKTREKPIKLKFLSIRFLIGFQTIHIPVSFVAKILQRSVEASGKAACQPSSSQCPTHELSWPNSRRKSGDKKRNFRELEVDESRFLFDLKKSPG